jgi:hypothetical protein
MNMQKLTDCLYDDTAVGNFQKNMDKAPKYHRGMFSRTWDYCKKFICKTALTGALLLGSPDFSSQPENFETPRFSVVFSVAQAQSGMDGVISMSWCPPSDTTGIDHYKASVTSITGSPGFVQIVNKNVAPGVTRCNIPGLKPGIKYRAGVASCDVNDVCYQSANVPEVYPIKYGNVDTTSISSTINRIDTYDIAKISAYTKGNITPSDPMAAADLSQTMDFFGKGYVDATHLQQARAVYGQSQPYPPNGKYWTCATCPEPINATCYSTTYP